MEAGSGLLNAIGSFYSAADEAGLQQQARDIHARFTQVEKALGSGPYFDGGFGLVDAVFGPVFRYFEVFDTIGDFGVLDGLPNHCVARRWRTSASAVSRIAARIPAASELGTGWPDACSRHRGMKCPILGAGPGGPGA